ncbi:MAG: cupin [Rhodospirillaceae bacterium]|jgi:cupin fold WbuC family metalloprotein|nr:cupin [Rhodospirillaceae bacterium]|tara:strand:- start:862 stop:1404 length:543 start_codon:yes stop_codon:yes gene_type:complete
MQDIREESEEVLYTTADIATAGDADIAALKERAARNPRKRCRLCTHSDSLAELHGMLIVHGRDAYVRPHRHAGKAETLHVIEGTAVLVVFDGDGAITRAEALAPVGSGRSFYYRMPEGVFHSLLITSDWLVFYESTTGPFDRTKTENAPWSPEDGDDDDVKDYMARLLGEADCLAANSEK